MNPVAGDFVRKRGYQKSMRSMVVMYASDILRSMRAAIFKNVQVHIICLLKKYREKAITILSCAANILCIMITNIYIFVAVDCQWNEWEIGECSKTCGKGVQIDTREKLEEEQFGGEPCTGEATRQKDCNVGKCPGKK